MNKFFFEIDTEKTGTCNDQNMMIKTNMKDIEHHLGKISV